MWYTPHRGHPSWHRPTMIKPHRCILYKCLGRVRAENRGEAVERNAKTPFNVRRTRFPSAVRPHANTNSVSPHTFPTIKLTDARVCSTPQWASSPLDLRRPKQHSTSHARKAANVPANTHTTGQPSPHQATVSRHHLQLFVLDSEDKNNRFTGTRKRLRAMLASQPAADNNFQYYCNVTYVPSLHRHYFVGLRLHHNAASVRPEHPQLRVIVDDESGPLPLKNKERKARAHVTRYRKSD